MAEPTHPLAHDTRIYYLAGTQHGPGRLPPAQTSTQYLTNPNDYRPILRALLEAMQAWLKDGTDPPPSQFPKLASGELTPFAQVKFPKIPAVELPAHPLNAWRADLRTRLCRQGHRLHRSAKTRQAVPGACASSGLGWQ